MPVFIMKSINIDFQNIAFNQNASNIDYYVNF
jgi:hypothetical protein